MAVAAWEAWEEWAAWVAATAIATAVVVVVVVAAVVVSDTTLAKLPFPFSRDSSCIGLWLAFLARGLFAT